MSNAGALFKVGNHHIDQAHADIFQELRRFAEIESQTTEDTRTILEVIYEELVELITQIYIGHIKSHDLAFAHWLEAR